MKIILSKSEFKHFDHFMKQIQVPTKYVGCTLEDPTIEISPSVVEDYLEQAIEQCENQFKRSVVRKEVIKRLHELPAGSLRKTK